MKRKLILVGMAAVAAVTILIWNVGTIEQWGPELATDPAYRSGRASLCKGLSPAGQVLPSEVQDLGLRPRDRGVERSRVYTFEVSQFEGGAIDVCSEYTFVKLAGTSGTQGRVEITVSNPFPGGDRAVDDTKVAAELPVPMREVLESGVRPSSSRWVPVVLKGPCRSSDLPGERENRSPETVAIGDGGN